MGLSDLVTCCLAGSGDGAPILLNRLAICITINEEEARHILDGDPRQLATVFLGGNTVLHLAAKSNAMEILQTALRLLRSPGAAANLTTVGSGASTSASAAVRRSSNGTHDADQAYFYGFLNRPNSSGMTALMEAAKRGHDGVVLALLEAVRWAWEARPVAWSPTQRMRGHCTMCSIACLPATGGSTHAPWQIRPFIVRSTCIHAYMRCMYVAAIPFGGGLGGACCFKRGSHRTARGRLERRGACGPQPRF